MSLMLPDERIKEVEVEACMDDAFPVDGDLIEQRMFRNRAIARTQARHMARECLDWWEGEADCYNVNQRKHFEAWLRQEGVM